MINRQWMAYSPNRENHSKNYDYNIEQNPRVILHGDYFLSSCTVGNYNYHECNMGFFKKLHNSSLMIRIEKEEFELAYKGKEVFVFCPRLGSPQAGLTRGSNSPKTSLDLKKQKHVIFQKWLNISLADRPSLTTFEEIELKKLNEGSI